MLLYCITLSSSRENQRSAQEVAGYTGISSSHFHHVGLIRVRYFDNLICGWTGDVLT